MDTAIIAAIIGGAVALIGTLVSVIAARHQARAEVRAQVRELTLDVTRQVLADIHSVHSTAELVRTWCWEALARLPRILSAPAEQRTREIGALKESLEKNRSSFMTSWAPLRHSLPKTSEQAFLGVVYRARSRIGALEAELELLTREDVSGNSVNRWIERLAETLTQLREDLLEVVHVTTAVRLAWLESQMHVKAEPSPPAYPGGRATAPSGSAEA